MAGAQMVQMGVKTRLDLKYPKSKITEATPNIQIEMSGKR